jgi:hypothetical protein
VSTCDRRWTIVDRASFSWRIWDDGTVLYDARSDEILRFDGVTGEVFEELLSKPLSLGQLSAVLSERLGVLADHELEQLIDEILGLLASKKIATPLD